MGRQTWSDTSLALCNEHRICKEYCSGHEIPKFQDSSSWMRGDGEHFVAMAEFDFASEGDGEISFKTGDEIWHVQLNGVLLTS